jgi:hypothetical protein
VQFARSLDAFELLLDALDPVGNHTPVGLDLGFARPAEEAEAAALAFQMRPGADEPALLIIQMRQFDLKRAFPRSRPLAENFKNEARPVDDLRVPCLLEIALLNGTQCVIDKDEARLLRAHQTGNLLDLSFSQECCRPNRCDRDDPGIGDFEIDCPREPDRFLQSRFNRARAVARIARAALHMRNDDDNALGQNPAVQPIACPCPSLYATRFQLNLVCRRAFVGRLE